VKQGSKILAVIPARFQSKRLPGKILTPVAGKPLLQRLYKEVSQSKLIDRIIIAADSKEVVDIVEKFGGEAILTSKKHRTGSDRTAEVMHKLGGQIIINIQADHLGVGGAAYDRILKNIIEDKEIKFATIARKIERDEQLYNPDRVKLLFDSSDNALWFSRYPLPFLRGVDSNHADKFDFYYHIGVYFFRKSSLKMFSYWPRTAFEKAESLEQLRILENHEKIRVFKTKRNILSVDAPEDLKKIEKHFILHKRGKKRAR
jgi:3-deoxy-manno-octulosonate cytidylyltransferase (CMP-KDO synthetase)